VIELSLTFIRQDILQSRFEKLCSLDDNDPSFELMKQNLKFLTRIVLAVVKMYKNKEVYNFYYYFISRYLQNNFNETSTFNWHELKSLLFYTNYFKDATSFSAFRKLFLKDSFHLCLAKYKRNDAVDNVRAIQAKSYYATAMTKQMSLNFEV
jgi:hypothetical protein